MNSDNFDYAYDMLYDMLCDTLPFLVQTEAERIAMFKRVMVFVVNLVCI